MNYANIINADLINTIITIASIVLALLAAFVFTTTIIVQVIKSAFAKLPTNYLTIIVSILVTVTAMLIATSVMEITVMWYYAVGAVVLGFFVAYAAMFGFDKFKEAWDKLKALRELKG